LNQGLTCSLGAWQDPLAIAVPRTDEVRVMSLDGGNWRARWAVILTLAWMAWLGGSYIVWEAASTRPDLGLGWEPERPQAFAASVCYAASRSLSYSTEATLAWPVWREHQDLTAGFLGGSGEAWDFFYIPESPTGKYAPNIQNAQYPPLNFFIGALGLAAFDYDATGAQAASNVLLLAFVAVMAWHGWQLAGFRGAVLLGLAAAASPWTSQWLRFYNYQPGGLLMLAIAMVAAHSSKGLTRPAFCAWLGITLGVGFLFVQLVLLVCAPWLVALVFRDLVRSRYSLLAGGLLLLVVQVSWTRYLWLVHRGPKASEWMDTYVFCTIVSLLLLILGTAWIYARKRGWRPVTGLAVTVAAAGLVSAPYYVGFQSSHLEYFQTRMQEVRPSLVGAIADYTRTLHTFHWFGLLWLAVGVLVLVRWQRFGSLGFHLAFSVLGGLLLMAASGPVGLKYLVTLLPLALVLGFVWAARWTASFIGVALFLVGTLFVQTVGWLDVRNHHFRWVPVPIVTPDELPGKMVSAHWFYNFPVASLLGEDPWIWDQIPPGLRLSLLLKRQPIPLTGGSVPYLLLKGSEVECLAVFLSLRGQLVEPGLLREGDYVLIGSRLPFNLPPEPGAGRLRLSGPDHFQSRDRSSPYPLLLQLRRVQSTP